MTGRQDVPLLHSYWAEPAWWEKLVAVVGMVLLPLANLILTMILLATVTTWHR